MSHLEKIFKEGAVSYDESTNSNHVECVDGFTVSVIAGPGAYCNPRPGRKVSKTFSGPYTSVEVSFPSERPEPWVTWVTYCENPTVPLKTVYGYVPVDVVRELIKLHGGER